MTITQDKITKVWNEAYQVFEKGKPVGLEYPKEPLIRWIKNQRKTKDKTAYFQDQGQEHSIKENFEGKALDLGFGTIANLKFLQSKGYTCFGLEVSEEAVYRGREQLISENISDIKLDSWKPPLLPFENNSFQLACGLQCLYYNLEMEKVIEEVYRILRPGGIFMFSFFSPQHDYMKYTQIIDENIIQWTDEHPNPRLRGTYQRRIKSKEQLRELFKKFRELDVFVLETDQTALFTSWWYITGKK